MNCEHCEEEMPDKQIECESCNGLFCSDCIKSTDIGKVCIDCFANLDLEEVNAD